MILCFKLYVNSKGLFFDDFSLKAELSDRVIKFKSKYLYDSRKKQDFVIVFHDTTARTMRYCVLDTVKT